MLEEYKKKRNLTRSKEPPPKVKKGEGPLTFVVHKHAARQLHYDLRLELDGVLKSWALPHGPSFDPAVKRLAVMVEDHPLDYGSFEGVIPPGEYGAGEVIIWDKGTYSPESQGVPSFDDRDKAQEMMRPRLEEGKVSVIFCGERLKGSWALVKMQHRQKDWLLIKHKDEYARPGSDDPDEDSSVVSGVSLADLRENATSVKSDPPKLTETPGIRKAPFPSTLPIMLASPTKSPFNSPDWIFEPKLDGYRTIAFIRNSKTKLVSRGGFDVTEQYSDVVADLNKQKEREVILDGEIVMLDETGRPCFQCLQNHLQLIQGNRSGSAQSPLPIIYYVFDILYLNGYDLRNVPLIERKKLLTANFKPSDSVRTVEYFEKDGVTLFETSVNLGFEGVVAKKKDSVYESGRRSSDWLKIKSTLTDDFVIGGFTDGTGNRVRTFGALLLGQYDKNDELVFTGHVGTGFDEPKLEGLRRTFDTIVTDKSPYAVKPHLNAATHWVRPELVAEVKFSEWTRDGYVRAPVFLRLRDDKTPKEVRMVKDTPTPDDPPPSASSIKDRGRRSIKNTRPPEPSKTSSLSLTQRENSDGFTGNIFSSESLNKIIELLQEKRKGVDIDIDGFKQNLSHLDKELWPAAGKQRAYTKRDLLIYLARVSPYLLPHLKERPLTMNRFPDGIYGGHFYQRHWDNPIPDFVETVPLPDEGGGSRDYIMCNNLSSLLWLGQLANLEFHSWFSRISPDPGLLIITGLNKKDPDFFADYPDFIIFDIDPYIYSGKEAKGEEPELNRQAFTATARVALWLKDALDNLSLDSFVKTSGKTGLHVHVPVVRQFNYTAVRSAAKTIADFLLKEHPQEITTDWTVSKRAGKIFIDYNQNVRSKTLASIYSPRPTPHATVSAPLKWDEVGRVYPSDFTIETMPKRLAKMGDLWANILEQSGDLRAILKMQAD